MVAPVRSGFSLSGPIVGAVRTTQRQKWVDPRYKRYQVFKSRLRYAASAAGVAESLDPKKSYAVMLHVFWTGRARCDLDNVLKAVLDGLWRNDRRVLSVTCSALENMESESLTVWLSERA